MAKMIQHTEKTREEVIREQYIPLFEEIEGESFVEYCKEYVLKDDVDTTEEKAFLHKEKIFRWYVPTLEKEEIDGFLSDFDYTIEELYDDPLMVYRIVDYEKDD